MSCFFRTILIHDQGLSEVLDDVEWTKPRNDVLNNKDHVWTSSKLAFSPKRTTFDSASGHEEPLFSRGAQLRSLSAHHRQKLGNIIRRIGAGSDVHLSLADRASEINDEVSRQEQVPILQILTPSDKMIRQIQCDRRMPTGQIEVKSYRKPHPLEVSKTRTTGAMFKFHDNMGARTLVNEIVLQHKPPKIRCVHSPDGDSFFPLCPMMMMISNLLITSALPNTSFFCRPAPRAPSDRPHGVKMGGGFRPVTVFPDHDEELLTSTIQTGLSLVPHSSGLRPEAPLMPIRTPRGFNVKKMKPKRPNTFFV